MTRLLQEDHLDDPWRVLVVCALCNRTDGRAQVAAVLPDLFRRYPTAERMSVARLPSLSRCIRSLGLQNRRAALLRALSRAWCRQGHTDLRAIPRAEIEALPACGRYAADAYDLLVAGRDVEPDDGWLSTWREERCAQTQ